MPWAIALHAASFLLATGLVASGGLVVAGMGGSAIGGAASISSLSGNVTLTNNVFRDNSTTGGLSSEGAGAVVCPRRRAHPQDRGGRRTIVRCLLYEAHAQRLGDRMHAVDGVELLRGVGEILVGSVHRQLQEARDLVAGLAIGGELEAF